VKSLDADAATKTQGMDFNHLTRDLYQNINAGNNPKWDLYVQVITPDQLDDFDFNPLDATKTWPDVKERKVGTMTLNRMPDNFFEETEQSAFAPANLIPGIEPSEDRLLQGRIFSYSDTQLYRLGANHNQLPINKAKVMVDNHNQDGAMNLGNSKSNVNYEPSRIEPKAVVTAARAVETKLDGTVMQKAISKQDNFGQAGALYRSFDKQQQANLIRNLSGDLGQVKDAVTKHKMLAHFYKADRDYGTRLTKAVNGDLKQVQQIALSL
jgi:catalase